MRAKAIVVGLSLALAGCGMGRVVSTVGSGFDRAACLSKQLKEGVACDQSKFGKGE